MDQAMLRSELHYNPESGVFTRLIARGGQSVGDSAGYVNKSRGYVLIDVCGKTYQAHRLAWLYMTGAWPAQTIDHRNRVRSDNKWANLRDVSQTANNLNIGMRKDNTSGFKGVYWHKTTGKWLVLGFLNKKQTCLGYFSDWFDAVCARQSWNLRLPV